MAVENDGGSLDLVQPDWGMGVVRDLNRWLERSWVQDWVQVATLEGSSEPVSCARSTKELTATNQEVAGSSPAGPANICTRKNLAIASDLNERLVQVGTVGRVSGSSPISWVHVRRTCFWLATSGLYSLTQYWYSAAPYGADVDD